MSHRTQYPTGVSQADIFTQSGTAGASAAVDMGRGYEHIRISNLDAAALLYVDMKGGTASAADFGIPFSSIFEYDGPPIQTIALFSAGTPLYSILAW